MKVAILNDYLTAYGGAERVLDCFLELYPEADIFTSQFWPEYFPENYKNRKVNTSFIDMLPHSVGLRDFYRQFSFLIFKYFDLNNYDLIISNTNGPATWFKKEKKQKVIAYYHKIPSFNLIEEKKRGPIQSFFAKRNKKYTENIDLLITNSKYNANLAQSSLNKEAQVIYPPVDVSLIEGILREVKNESLKNYIEWEPKSYFIFIGRLEEFKGIKYIVDSCIEANQRLVVIGEGELFSKLPTHENIKYLGFAEEKTKFALLSNAKALINGAVEQYGIVFAESLISETPVIAYNDGGAAELIKEGQNGILFDQQNKESVINALNRFNKTNLHATRTEQIIDKEEFKSQFKKLILNL